MVFHDGQVSLQAGGGITSDSDEHDEYVETLNKLASSLTALKTAEGAPILLLSFTAAEWLTHAHSGLCFDCRDRLNTLFC